ncbi:MAG: glycosyltransferase family 2 protein [Patescibacteria group bacterium]
MRPTLSIIIVNWNTKKLTKQCLDSILTNDKRLDLSGRATVKEEVVPTEIIVVDNGSTDDSIKYLKSLKKIKIIFNKDNLGFGKANNQGIKTAQGEYVLLLNSDTIIKEGAISQTVHWMAAHPEAAVAGCKLLNPDGSSQSSFGSFPDLATVFLMLFKEHFLGSKKVRRTGNKIEETDWVMGAFLLTRKSTLEQAGLLDEGIFMYMEEVEWCYRVKQLGLKIFFYPNAKITHLGRGSSASGKTDPILNIFRGLNYFYRKHKSPTERLILKLMLKAKALSGWTIGILTKNDYLKSTYSQAFKLA